MAPPDADAVADRLARQQFGAFARWQLLERGVHPDVITRRLRRCRWIAVDSGVYVLPSHPRSWLQRAMAASLGQTGSVLGGRSGAALWQVGGIERRGPIDLVVPPAAHHQSKIARVRRSQRIERRVVDGIPVNSPPLVLLDLAATHDERLLGRVFDDAVIAGHCRIDHLGDWLVRTSHARLPGSAKLRSVARERGSGYVPAESELEARLFGMLDAPGIPRVERQAPFPWRPSLPNRVDGRLVGWPVLVEGDGRAWHARLEQMAADVERDREALAHGLLTLRFSWIDVTEHIEPSRVHVRAVGAQWAPAPR